MRLRPGSCHVSSAAGSRTREFHIIGKALRVASSAPEPGRRASSAWNIHPARLLHPADQIAARLIGIMNRQDIEYPRLLHEAHAACNAVAMADSVIRCVVSSSVWPAPNAADCDSGSICAKSVAISCHPSQNRPCRRRRHGACNDSSWRSAPGSMKVVRIRASGRGSRKSSARIAADRKPAGRRAIAGAELVPVRHQRQDRAAHKVRHIRPASPKPARKSMSMPLMTRSAPAALEEQPRRA